MPMCFSALICHTLVLNNIICLINDEKFGKMQVAEQLHNMAIKKIAAIFNR